MTEQPLGIRAEYTDAGLNRGLDNYNQRISQATMLTERFAKTADQTFNRSLGQAAQKSIQNVEASIRPLRDRINEVPPALDNYNKAVDKTIDTNRKFIKSISGVYATFVLAPRVAQEFGEALKNAAAGRAVRESFENLAESVGVNSEKLLASLTEASKGTVAQIDLMRDANRAFLAGGREFALALPRLFEIARAAAVSTGKDVTFVLDSLVTGIARGSAKLIDNAEVYIRVGSRVDEYAESLGKSADELTEVERRQATLQAVLEEGEGLIAQVGSDTEVATDAFTKYEVAVQDAKQATLEFFIDALGAENLGKFKAGTDLLVDFSGALQTLALLSIASGAPLTIFFGKLAIAAVAISAGIGAAKELVNAFKDLQRQVEEGSFDLQNYADGLSKIGQPVPAILTELTGVGDVIENLTEKTDEQATALSDDIDELEAFTAQLGIGRAAYDEYVAKVDELNAALPDTEDAYRAASYEAFRFHQIIGQGKGSLDLQIATVRTAIDNLREYRVELLKAGESQRAIIPTILQLILTWQREGLEADRAAQKEAEAAAAAERAAEARRNAAKEIEKVLDDLSRLLEKRRELELDTNKDIEDEERRHGRKMVDLARDAARDRADAYRDYNQDIIDAERERQRDLEEAQRRHAFRLAEIERRYRERLLEIQERFRFTVHKAAIRRDALAIIEAREQRAQEIREAQRDRDSQVRSENESYQESLRQIEQNFRDRLDKLQRQLEEELRRIEQNLLDRQRKEDEDHRERMRKLDEKFQEEYNKYELELTKLNNLIIRKRNEIQGYLNQHPVLIPIRHGGQGGTGAIHLQHGFAGMVQGPQTFRVEPGVTEFVYASGHLSGARESVGPGAAATNAMAMRHSVTGALGVGLSGMSSRLVDQIGPQLTETISQAVIDSMADSILRSLN